MKLTIVTLAAAIIVTFTSRADAGDMTVKVSHDGFSPQKVTIDVGDTITFENQVNMPGGHTLVADDGSFESKPLATPGAKWSHKFTKAGMLGYAIQEHAWAKGTIVVK